MAKTFAEYERERGDQMSPEGRELGRAFHAAAMFGSVLYKARKVRRLLRAARSVSGPARQVRFGPTYSASVPASSKEWRCCQSCSSSADFPVPFGPAIATRFGKSSAAATARPRLAPTEKVRIATRLPVRSSHRSLDLFGLVLGEGLDVVGVGWVSVPNRPRSPGSLFLAYFSETSRDPRKGR